MRLFKIMRLIAACAY